MVTGVAAGADDERLQAEKKREDENFQTAAADRADDCSATVTGPRQPRGRQGNAEPGQPQEQRRREAAKHEGPPKSGGMPVSRARPRVDCVPRDHQENGQAARPVDVNAAAPRVLQWHEVILQECYRVAGVLAIEDLMSSQNAGSMTSR